MSAISTAQVPDRRRSPRQRALLAGKLATGDAGLTIDCAIRNISEEGALVETGSPQLIPDELHLVQIREGVAWDAKVAWKRGSKVGLTLLKRHDLRTTTEPALKSLKRVWTHMTGAVA